jgi:uncharacterized protein (TIRG00374 family)
MSEPLHRKPFEWRRLWSSRVRAAIGIPISILLLVAALSRIDLDLLGGALAAVSVVVLFLAAAISVVEVSVRAVRWQLLLSPFAAVSFRDSLAYLSVGHLLNGVLPARLGDVMRALLTGVRLRVSRVSVLGTIAVERLADAAVLGMALTVGVLVGFRTLAPTLFTILLVGAAVAGIAVVGLVLLRRGGVAATRIGALLQHHGGRFLAGAKATRDPRKLAAMGGLTILSFALAIAIFATVAMAVGLSVPLWQSALIIAALTLSTAIPSGPASIGTYEFIGMTVMTSMGYPAESSLLCVALVHVVALVPASFMGLAAMWWLGIRVPSLHADPARTEAVG